MLIKMLVNGRANGFRLMHMSIIRRGLSAYLAYLQVMCPKTGRSGFQCVLAILFLGSDFLGCAQNFDTRLVGLEHIVPVLKSLKQFTKECSRLHTLN
jgi:hypothetical protein